MEERIYLFVEVIIFLVKYLNILFFVFVVVNQMVPLYSLNRFYYTRCQTNVSEKMC